MTFIVFLFYLFSSFTGVAVISAAFFIYFTYKKEVIKSFIIFISSLFFIQLGLLINIFLEAGGGGAGPRMVSTIIDNGGVILLVYGAPLFIAKILGLNTVKWKRVFCVSAITVAIMSILYNGGIERAVSAITARSIMVSSIIWAVAAGIIYRNNISDVKLRKIIWWFMTVSIIFLPLIIIEPFREYLKFFNWGGYMEAFSLPLYFAVINILNLAVSIKYLNKPAAIDKETGKLSRYFREYYKITEREEEIIICIMNGNTYKEIADKLFIAYKTVDNHIQNIYQKTGVGSKQQLKALIESNN